MTFDKIVQKQQILYYKSCLWRQNDFLFLFFKYNLWLFLNVSCNLYGANHWFTLSLFWTLWQERSEAEMCLGGLEKAVTAPQHAISTLCKSQELEMQLSFRGCVPHFMFLENVFLKNRRLPFCSLCIQVME